MKYKNVGLIHAIAGALRLPSSINIARFLLGSPNTFIVEFNFFISSL